MKRTFLLIAIVLLMTAASCFAVLSGSGTAQSPWVIGSKADFNEFRGDSGYWSGHVRLDVDLWLTDVTYSKAPVAFDTNDASSGFDGMAFTGVFDGSGHKIWSFDIDPTSSTYDYLGLFGKIGSGGLVKDLGVKVHIRNGDEYLGGLAGENSGTIENCYCETFIECGSGAGYVGGMVGYNVNGTINNSYCINSVIRTGTSNLFVGGLVGRNSSGPVSYCYANTSVLVGDGSQYVGGFAGGNFWSVVTRCFSSGEVGPMEGESGLIDFAGGFAGVNSSSSNVNNCYAQVSVQGDDYVGGFSGRHTSSGIVKCYSTGLVSGNTRTGGFIGDSDDADPDVYDSYWDAQTSGMGTSDGGTPRVTIYMKQASWFTNWDFEETWQIVENQSYPLIRFFGIADLNKDGIVDLYDVCLSAKYWLEEMP